MSTHATAHVQPPRLIGYARVSTEEQVMYGYGLDAQATTLRDYARMRGAEITIARDEGISGKSLERPALMRSLRAIANREADGLVVTKLDRLSRSTIDFMMLAEWFLDAKAILVALDSDLDTGTPNGKFFATIVAGMAEWERGTIAARTRTALAAARAAGKPVGPPSVVDRPDLAEQIRELRNGGMTYQAICDKLNSEGVPTMRGGSEWRPSAVQSVLGYQRTPPRRKIAALPELKRR